MVLLYHGIYRLQTCVTFIQI